MKKYNFIIIVLLLCVTFTKMYAMDFFKNIKFFKSCNYTTEELGKMSPEEFQDALPKCLKTQYASQWINEQALRKSLLEKKALEKQIKKECDYTQEKLRAIPSKTFRESLSKCLPTKYASSWVNEHQYRLKALQEKRTALAQLREEKESYNSPASWAYDVGLLSMTVVPFIVCPGIFSNNNTDDKDRKVSFPGVICTYISSLLIIATLNSRESHLNDIKNNMKQLTAQIHEEEIIEKN